MQHDDLNIHAKSLPPEKLFSLPSIWISIFALAVSIVSVGVTIFYHFSSKTAVPLTISSYSIVRSLGPFPSDHLIVPIEWVNKGGRAALVRQPILILKEKDKDRTLYFFIAGQFSELSEPGITDAYKREQSFLIEGHSAKTLTLVFHIENWWDDKKPSTYDFHFAGQEEFQLTIRFLDEQGDCWESDLGTINTYDAANLNRKAGYWWGFWPVELGHKHGQPPNKALHQTSIRRCAATAGR